MSEGGYPPGPMSGAGGPMDPGCPCGLCPFLDYGECNCSVEPCDCGLACSEHCTCYSDEEDEQEGVKAA